MEVSSQDKCKTVECEGISFVIKVNWEKTEVMKVGKVRGHCCVEVGDRKS